MYQNYHIWAPDKARTFNEISLKSSDSGLSRGAIYFHLSVDPAEKNYFFFKKSRVLTKLCQIIINQSNRFYISWCTSSDEKSVKSPNALKNSQNSKN